MNDNTPLVVSTNPINKYIVLVSAFILSVLLLIGSYYLGKQSNKIIANIEVTESQKEQVPKEDKKPVSKLSTPVMSPNNELYLELKSKESDNSYILELILDDFPNLHAPIISLEGEDTDDAVLTQITGTKEQLERMFYYISNYISWSPKTNTVALLLPEKVIVYNYSVSPILNDTFSPNRNKVTLQKYKEYSIKSDFDNFDYPVLVFSGNGQNLYYSSSAGIKELLPLEKDFKPQLGYYSSHLYPIPNKSGVAYWVDTGTTGGRNHSLVLDYGSSSSKFNLISNFSIDYHKEIELSPDLRKACVGWETSGSHGKILFDLETGKQIQYGTGCIRWLNSNEVVVYESDSYSGSASGNVSYYLINLKNDTKTLLHNYSSSLQ